MLRDVRDEDVDVFFEHQLDPDARWMAAFTAEDPTDRAAFAAHWARVRANEAGTVNTIVDGECGRLCRS